VTNLGGENTTSQRQDLRESKIASVPIHLVVITLGETEAAASLASCRESENRKYA